MRSIRARTERRARRGGEREAFLVFLFSIFILSGCGGDLAAPIARGHAGDETPRRGGTLHLASFGDLRGGLDPSAISEGLSVPIVALVFDGLVAYNEAGNIVPGLAERWDIDEAGTTYRFVLRQGVRFHDGEELTADDVKRSVERALHPSTPNPSSSFYENLAGYTGIY